MSDENKNNVLGISAIRSEQTNNEAPAASNNSPYTPNNNSIRETKPTTATPTPYEEIIKIGIIKGKLAIILKEESLLLLPTVDDEKNGNTDDKKIFTDLNRDISRSGGVGGTESGDVVATSRTQEPQSYDIKKPTTKDHPSVVNEEAIPFTKNQECESKDIVYYIFISNDGWKITSRKGSIDAIEIPSDHILDENRSPSSIAIATRLYLLASISDHRKKISDAWLHAIKNDEPSKQEKIGKSRFCEKCRQFADKNLPKKFIEFFTNENNHKWLTLAFTLLPVFTSIFMTWMPIWHLNLNSYAIAAILLFSCLPFSINLGIAIFNSTTKSQQDKIVEKIASKTKNILSSINQDNTKVAGNFIQFDGTLLNGNNYDWYVPEPFLRLIDEKLRIKESIESITKVLDLQALTASHKEDKDHRLHLSKSITAAGSGIFTGFITYEMGESVLKYIHTATNADDRTLQYWLHTKAGGAANKVKNVDFSTAMGEHTEAHTISTTAELDKAYHENFAHHEMIGQAWLLTATIIFTFLAMCIGYIKPHESGHEGHGHH